jgi:hypothetical protein
MTSSRTTTSIYIAARIRVNWATSAESSNYLKNMQKVLFYSCFCWEYVSNSRYYCDSSGLAESNMFRWEIMKSRTSDSFKIFLLHLQFS